MRVLTVGNMYPPHSYGGYEAVWRAAVQHLRARGHEARVLTTDTRTETHEPDDPDVHRELRWHLHGGEFARLSAPARVRMARHNHAVLRRHLEDMRPDAVAWWSMGGLTMTLLEDVRRRGLPAVAFVHDDWLAYGPAVDPWLRALSGPRRGRAAALAEALAHVPARVDFAHAADYVFVSDFTRRRALGLGLGIPEERTRVAHSGISEDYLRAAPPQPWGWRLLYVGRLDPRKGVEDAVRATALLPEATLELIGGWDEREEQRLRALAAELGIEARVHFSGQRGRRDIAAAYERCDVTVFPVRWEEPWGLVPLEAMAVGRPVVATGRGGSAEYLRDGENCVLFAAGDPEALAAAVRRLADDEPLRARLREGGLATAPEHTERHLNEAVERALEAALERLRVR
ncbi:MAG TPA: glycosyltransferase [Solirubrobacteraceae bacterium]|nr:glycosyltransferase [Solirubrobacteraceae bacterium]